MATRCPSCGTRNLEGVDQCTNCGADLRSVDLPKPHSAIEQAMMELPLTAMNLSRIHSVTPDTTIDDAIQTLLRQKLDILAVVEEERLVGLLSVRDIMMRVGLDYEGKLKLPVRDFMTISPESLPPDAPIIFAVNKMDVGGYRHVPVVQDERPLGVVSTRDVIRWLEQHSRQKLPPVGVTPSHVEPG
jgi:CBS domain-containing protein